MARRSSSASAASAGSNKPSQLLQALRTMLQITCTVAAAITAVVVCLKAEQFVILDSRFHLPGPPESEVSSDDFQITGARYASEDQIAAIFARDFGRSVYLCPIAERRRRLLALKWVKDAKVLRIWPNRIVIDIEERTPVAFAQVPASEGVMSYALVDEDGVLLDPQKAVKLNLPVLVGLSATEAEKLRRERVKRFLRLQSELAEMMAQISEIDVGELDNVKVTQIFEGRALTLLLGNQKFRERMQNFLDNYGEIRKLRPNAAILDLRLGDRILAPGHGVQQ